MAIFGLPPLDPAIEFSIASRGISKGIAQTDDEPQAVIKASAKFGAVETSGQWKNVTSTSAKGEAALSINASRAFGKLRLNSGAAYKFQTGVTGVTGSPDSDSFEFTLGGNAAFGDIALRATAIFSPDDLGSAKRSLYLEGGPTLALGDTLRASASVGRREREGAPDYTAFNLGLSKIIAKTIIFDLRYHDTAQGELGFAYRARGVLSARVTF